MTIGEAIDHTDRLKPNQYGSEDKIGWLAKLDGMIWEAVILTHQREDETETFTPYTSDTDTTTVLLVPEPWAEDVYHYWLSAQIDKENGEVERFNQNITMFNSAYEMYAAWYNRARIPAVNGTRFVF